MALRQPEMVRWMKALTAAGPPWESIPARIPGRANVAGQAPRPTISPPWRRAGQSAVDLLTSG